MGKRRSKPLLIAGAGAATILFGCRPRIARIGPTPPLPTPVPEEIVVTATVAPTASPIPTIGRDRDPDGPMHIGPPTEGPEIAIPDPGRIDIASNRRARIYVDGIEEGAAPITGMLLEYGPHVIVAVDEKTGVAIEFRVVVGPNEYLRRKLVFPE